MQSKDKDFRFMATADLVTELEKDTFRMDADSEKKITQSVLKLLEDSSNQVQEIAVKWFVFFFLSSLFLYFLYLKL